MVKCRQTMFFMSVHKNAIYNGLFFHYKFSSFNFKSIWNFV